MTRSPGTPGDRGLGKRCPGSLQERQLLSNHLVLLFSAGAGNRPGTAPGAENHPSVRQAKGRRPGITGADGRASLWLPLGSAGNPDGFAVFGSAGVQDGAEVSLSVPPRSLPSPQPSGPLHPHGSSQSGSPGRAGPQGVPLGTGHTVPPEIWVLGDKSPSLAI